MKAEARKYLFDMQQAASLIDDFCRHKSFDAYLQDAMLRSAVERQFEIIGEALGKLLKLDASFTARIPDAPRIIAFRNVLIHGYATISHKLVWSVVTDDLPRLISAIGSMADEP